MGSTYVRAKKKSNYKIKTYILPKNSNYKIKIKKILAFTY